jgi:rubredoxin
MAIAAKGRKAWVTIERGARCPKCGRRSKVYRVIKTEGDIIRERYCPKCDARRKSA